MTVWFDVEDLVQYFPSGNTRISGIQRLTFEIIRAARQLEGGPDAVRLVRHGARPLSFLPVEWSELERQFDTDGEPAPDAPVASAAASGPIAAAAPAAAPSAWRRAARRARERMPSHVREPLVLATVMQAQVVGALARFGVNLAAAPARAALSRARTARRARLRTSDAPSDSFEALSRPGDTLLVLGAPWVRERYSDIARWLRDERRMRFGVLVHDLVPIRHPEWCHRGVPRGFREWYTDVLPMCDVVLANSRHTARDVEDYARESGIVLNGPVQALPIGTGFGRAAAAGPAPRSPRLPQPGSYVLFVSTLEARKNHALAFRVWSRLLDEVASGRRAPDSVPDLVFAGRVGWLVSDLMAKLENTCWLGGRIRLVREPSDAELRALYEGCLFTFFPSLFEGWGLPVTESLALGKPCLTSDAAALPEAGGALCRYFDPEDLGAAHREVAAVLDDRPGLANWERAVRDGFRPTPWTETARALLAVVAALETPPA